MTSSKAITADLIWMDGAFREGVTIQTEGGVITGVTSDGVVSGAEDWGHVAIVPGSVNAHGHAFQNLFKGFSDDLSFDSWRDDVLYPFSEGLSGDDIYVGAVFAFSEALLAGVTTIVDFFYLHDEGNENAERVIEAAKDAGIRLVFARAFYDVDAPTKAPQRYRESTEDSARRFLELHAKHSGNSMVSIQAAPHSLHAAGPETIAVALEAAKSVGAPCHLHLAEASYEVEQVRQRYGTTPIRLLADEGLLDESLVTIHTVWADDEELDLLAQHRVGVVHCPGANAFLGDGIARVPEMLRRGLRVALGPDGGCANNRQSVFDEMRMASLVAKARLTDGSALGAPEAFRMGTAVGAELLKMPVGIIEAGRRADLVALDLNDLSLQPPQNLDRHLVHSMQATAIETVMVEGEIVAEGGKLQRLRNSDVISRVAEVTKGWSRPKAVKQIT